MSEIPAPPSSITGEEDCIQDVFVLPQKKRGRPRVEERDGYVKKEPDPVPVQEPEPEPEPIVISLPPLPPVASTPKVPSGPPMEPPAGKNLTEADIALRKRLDALHQQQLGVALEGLKRSTLPASLKEELGISEMPHADQKQLYLNILARIPGARLHGSGEARHEAVVPLGTKLTQGDPVIDVLTARGSWKTVPIRPFMSPVNLIEAAAPGAKEVVMDMMARYTRLERNRAASAQRRVDIPAKLYATKAEFVQRFPLLTSIGDFYYIDRTSRGMSGSCFCGNVRNQDVPVLFQPSQQDSLYVSGYRCRHIPAALHKAFKEDDFLYYKMLSVANRYGYDKEDSLICKMLEDKIGIYWYLLYFAGRSDAYHVKRGKKLTKDSFVVLTLKRSGRPRETTRNMIHSQHKLIMVGDKFTAVKPTLATQQINAGMAMEPIIPAKTLYRLRVKYRSLRERIMASGKPTDMDSFERFAAAVFNQLPPEEAGELAYRVQFANPRQDYYLDNMIISVIGEMADISLAKLSRLDDDESAQMFGEE